MAIIRDMGYVHGIVNSNDFVNKDQFDPWYAELKLADTLHKLLSRITWLRGWNIETISNPDFRWNLEVFIPLPTGITAVLYVACKTNFQPGRFPSIAQKPYPT